jgi:hypothetical protein
MRPSLGGVLAVDEAVIFFAIAGAVREGDLDIFPLDVDDRILRIFRELGAHEVHQTVLGLELLLARRCA